ncbi:hypothetical protein [Vallitalea okinawensis]|uniref:hypothetical protein n=1 Tax=Vallitalea okinawensis TaxID=2078660 RepID=UPI0014780906|nr:hypothetical protein [Vallitalea okinawensis]
MAKNFRGRRMKLEKGWRGTCPICNRTGVKLLWTSTDSEGKEIKVCKICDKKN